MSDLALITQAVSYDTSRGARTIHVDATIELPMGERVKLLGLELDLFGHAAQIKTPTEAELEDVMSQCGIDVHELGALVAHAEREATLIAELEELVRRPSA